MAIRGCSASSRQGLVTTPVPRCHGSLCLFLLGVLKKLSCSHRKLDRFFFFFLLFSFSALGANVANASFRKASRGTMQIGLNRVRHAVLPKAAGLFPIRTFSEKGTLRRRP
jgi:hypothetical protein